MNQEGEKIEQINMRFEYEVLKGQMIDVAPYPFFNRPTMTFPMNEDDLFEAMIGAELMGQLLWAGLIWCWQGWTNRKYLETRSV